MSRVLELFKKVLVCEKYYNYNAPQDKKLTMYDFYVLDYLNYILDRPSANHRDLPSGLEDSVKHAVEKLYPALRDELLHAVLYAMCAEIRHAENSSYKNENREIAFSNPKFEKMYKLYLKYINFKSKGQGEKDELTQIYGIRPPSAKKRSPNTESGNDYSRNLSYKAAQYAIEKSGYSTKDWVELCETLYNEGGWQPSYGGKAWGNICRGWLDLYEAEKINPNIKGDDKDLQKSTKKPMSVAIDHIYDLQHNTDTVFNKLKSYYKGGYGWIKDALDDKANVQTYHELLDKCSGTVKLMAIPILYNKLGQSWEKVMTKEHPDDGTKVNTIDNSIQNDKKEPKIVDTAKPVSDNFINTGDKLKCIDNRKLPKTYALTLGKIYISLTDVKTNKYYCRNYG